MPRQSLRSLLAMTACGSVQVLREVSPVSVRFGDKVQFLLPRAALELLLPRYCQMDVIVGFGVHELVHVVAFGKGAADAVSVLLQAPGGCW